MWEFQKWVDCRELLIVEFGTPLYEIRRAAPGGAAGGDAHAAALDVLVRCKVMGSSFSNFSVD